MKTNEDHSTLESTGATIAAPLTITCPICGMTSAHPMDVRAGYCPNCHDFTSARLPKTFPEAPPGASDVEVVTALGQAERDGARAPLLVGPFTAWVMISTLQLAWRHPNLSEDMRGRIRRGADQLISLYAGRARELLEAGWDPTQDQPFQPRR